MRRIGSECAAPNNAPIESVQPFQFTPEVRTPQNVGKVPDSPHLRLLLAITRLYRSLTRRMMCNPKIRATSPVKSSNRLRRIVPATPRADAS
jgi:hypothetical protein